MKRKPRAPDRYTVAGKVYEPVGPTSILHDVKAEALARRLGFYDEVGPDESFEDAARRKVKKVNESGQILDLLGFIVVPAGTPPEAWTEALATQTTTDLGYVAAPADRSKVQALLQEAISYFFAFARRSSTGSPSSSREQIQAAVQVARQMNAGAAGLN